MKAGRAPQPESGWKEQDEVLVENGYPRVALPTVSSRTHERGAAGAAVRQGQGTGMVPALSLVCELPQVGTTSVLLILNSRAWGQPGKTHSTSA